MKIRKLEQSEHHVVRPLYEEVFSEDRKEFVDYYFQEKTKDNGIYVIEQPGKDSLITAMLHLNPYEIKVNGQLVNVHYIVAVATKEAYRGQGYMAAILRQAITDMYLEEEPFTFLMPAAENIYLPHDFRTVFEQNRRCYSEKEHGEKGFYKAAFSDAGELADYANAYLERHYHVYVKRSEAYYQRLMKEYEADGACLMLRRVEEKLVDCVHYLPNQEGHAPKIMIRIVHLERMLTLLKVKRLTIICFHVTDPMIESNNKCVVLTGTECSGVMIMEGEQKNSEGTISVAVLGELIFGHMSVTEASEIEEVEMSERMKKELEKIIPLSKIYLNETV